MKTPRQGLIALAALVALGVAAAHPAHAQNLVANGDFETGDFTGWTHTDDNLLRLGNNSDEAHTGQYSVWFGSSVVDTLSQTIATQPGSSYVLMFWAYSTANTDYSFTASFGSQTLVSGTLPFGSNKTAYTQFSFPVTATTSSSLLQFTGYNNPGNDFLDDVSVVAAPEPSQYASLGLGVLSLAGLVLKARRRQAA
jgi:hypothetical protein